MMKKKYWPYRLMSVFVIFISSLFVSCGSGPDDSVTKRGKTSTILLEYRSPCEVWGCEAYPIPADGSSSIHIRATLTDSSGKPVDQLTTVTFTTDLGYFGNGEKSCAEKTPDDSGRIEVSLRAGTKTGQAHITCSSGGESQSGLVDFIEFDEAGRTTYIILTADSPSLPADGVSATNITATLTDIMQEPVKTGTPIIFHTNSGKFLSNKSKTLLKYTPTETGIVHISFIAGTLGGGADIVAYSNGVTQRLHITYTYPEDEDDDSDDSDDTDDTDDADDGDD